MQRLRPLRSRLLAQAAALPLALVAATPAFAQGSGPASPQTSATLAEALEEITVTATRIETRVSEVPASISILSGEEISRQLDVSPDVVDVLTKSIPGLAANNETPFSNGRGPLLRGRPASVLINGVPVNQLLRSSGFDLGLIDPLAVDRIEVNRGATAVFGFGASGGVINLQTRRGGDALAVTGRVQTSFNPKEFGDSLTYKVYAGAGGAPSANTDLYLGAGYMSQGIRHSPAGDPVISEEFDQYNVDANFGVELGEEASLRVSANYFRQNTESDYTYPAYTFGTCGLPPFDCSATIGNLPLDVAIADPGQRVDDRYRQNHILIATYSNGNVLGSVLDLSVYHQKNTFQYTFIISDFEDPPRLYEDENRQKNERFGLRSNLTSQVDFSEGRNLSLTYGVDLLRDEMDRPRFEGTTPTNGTYSLAGAPVRYDGGALREIRPLSPPVTLNSFAGFGQAKLTLGSVILQGGIRYEEFHPESDGARIAGAFGPGRDLVYLKGDMPDFNATLYNAGAVWFLTEDIEVFAGLSQGLEITEFGRALRGLATATVPGNPALVRAQPAKTTQYEAGLRADVGSLNFTASAFFADAKLSSTTVQISPVLPLEVLRQPERTWGFEATLDYRVNEWVGLGGVLTYQNGEFEDEDGVEFDQYNDRVTPTRITAYVDVAPVEDASLRLQGTHVFDRDQFGDTPPLVFGGSDGSVAGYFLLDLSASYDTGNGKVSVGIENLLNRRYLPVQTQAFRDLLSNIPGEGMRITVGYQHRF
ncbi:MAG TPA: TonB-dependent receptor [Azospirillaceae bacterium]|nr:TonB-dependent receptor [Azospirillaceae bacterium]